jgi:hypothetical protein
MLSWRVIGPLGSLVLVTVCAASVSMNEVLAGDQRPLQRVAPHRDEPHRHLQVLVPVLFSQASFLPDSASNNWRALATLPH